MNLPPLPEIWICCVEQWVIDQMRAYGEACAKAESGPLLDALTQCRENAGQPERVYQIASAAIRARGET